MTSGAPEGPRADGAAEPPWLLFIHQIPPKPAYFRAKVGRRLARLGAVAVKSTVYVVPRNAQTQEDLHWLAKEVAADGGEATICAAVFVEGLDDDKVRALFRAARDADFAEIAAEATRAAEARAEGAEGDERSVELARLRRRFSETVSIDFFDATVREVASQAILALERVVRGPVGALPRTLSREAYVGRTWVTRVGVHVDRIASAWLVRRFVDPDAAFKFVPPKGYVPLTGEIRFDMFDAEFTHEGDACTFEVIVARLTIDAPGIRALAEIIHDIDIKDGKFGRPETAGVASMIAGLALRHRDDDARLDRGFDLFDDLLAYFSRRAPA